VLVPDRAGGVRTVNRSMDFLSEIIALKKQRVAAAKTRLSLEQVRERGQVRASANNRNFADALRSYRGINLIAEFKRRSPSKGKINAQADPVAMAQLYESAGAAAVSMLTEEDYFEGSLEDLRQVCEVSSLPILRKDFIFDEYQVYESAAAGASALLLIVAALDDETLRKLRAITEDELGMTALVEVHTKSELDRAVSCGARVIGVNNRDLRTFNVSIYTSLQLIKVVPRDAILISESGLTPATVRQLREAGYRGFLVGETLMRASDPAKAVREFIEPEENHRPRSVWVKICGITSIDDARAAIRAGADMLGFNFYRPSPRFVEPQAAAEIIKSIRSEARGTDRSASMVGVFVDESIENVSRIAAEAGLDGIQLHGEEMPEYCERLKELCPQKFLIKALAARAGDGVAIARRYPVDVIMIDAFDEKLRGGTGRVADWSFAREMARTVPRVFLAGGLSPENVAEAIDTVRPYGVDVCSAVETEPGRKSARRMKQFVDAVRSSKLQDETASAGEGS